MTCTGSDIIINKARHISIYKWPHIVVRFVNIDSIVEHRSSSQCKTKQKLWYWKQYSGTLLYRSRKDQWFYLELLSWIKLTSTILFEFSKETPYHRNNRFYCIVWFTCGQTWVYNIRYFIRFNNITHCEPIKYTINICIEHACGTWLHIPHSSAQ